VKKVYVASDHAGYKAKSKLISLLTLELKLTVVDVGPHSSGRVDYPDYANLVCKKIIDAPENSFGLLICGSGQGMAMRANKFKNIRAALCWNKESTELARLHNHANVLCLGARLLELDVLKEITKTFFTTGEESGRHLQRVIKISKPTKETK
jgi:ribose 5-phosphate isomerase B